MTDELTDDIGDAHELTQDAVLVPAGTPPAAASPQVPSVERRSRKSGARAEVVKRLKQRNGRYYLDLRDLGKGREALIPEGQAYATKDELVARLTLTAYEPGFSLAGT